MKANLLLSGALLLMLISSLLLGQCLYYQFQIQLYRQISYDSQARSIYNLARINRLQPKEQLQTNLGRAANQGNDYRITLKNGWIYTYPAAN